MDLLHEISVSELKQVLNELQNDDILMPNRVGNLSIVRGDCVVGHINLLNSLQIGERVELYEEEK